MLTKYELWNLKLPLIPPHSHLLRNVQQSCDEVRRIALSLHNHGAYPSEARVSEQMSMPGYLRYRKVRTPLQDIQCQLGKC